MNNYFKIGKLAASTSLKGELVLLHNLGKKTALNGLEAIFLEDKKDNFIPYFIEYTKIRSAVETILKLEGIDVVELARKLTPKEVWITADDFKKFAAKSAPIAMLGFTIISNGKSLGEIIEVIEQPHQILCTIILNNKEVLIPLHQDSLDKLDINNKIVYVTIPDGLLEIYQ